MTGQARLSCRFLQQVGTLYGLLRQAGLLAVLFCLGWLLSMISLPILRWILGEDALPAGVIVSVLLQTLAVLAILIRAWGVRRASITAVMIVGLTWLVEVVGSSTGMIFGAYHYTQTLQPQVVGVPLWVPLAWLMMLPPSWAVAAVIQARFKMSSGDWWSDLVYALLSGLAFTAWDLFLDPQMVAWEIWVWEQPGGYFGIPWTNFAGWLLTATILTWIIRPKNLPLFALILVYGLTWALETIGQLFFWGLPGPAACGFLAMGGMLFWAFWRWKG